MWMKGLLTVDAQEFAQLPVFGTIAAPDDLALVHWRNPVLKVQGLFEVVQIVELVLTEATYLALIINPGVPNAPVSAVVHSSLRRAEALAHRVIWPRSRQPSFEV